LQLKNENKAPAIEICPTSNFFTLKLDSHAQHPLIAKLNLMKYPFSINTDDSGIFSTSISKELLHLHTSFNFDIDKIIDVLGDFIHSFFCLFFDVLIIFASRLINIQLVYYYLFILDKLDLLILKY
jgi:hypothetical protein